MHKCILLFPVEAGSGGTCYALDCVAAGCRVSQANATQRAGRSGRVQAGTCYRLYPQALFDVLDAYLAPEMQRMSLESVALTAKSIGA